MKLPATTVAALSLALTLTAAAQSAFTDPANLRGERVTPKTGRELPIDGGALGLQQLLRKLSTRASLMLIVAHPDDEDGGMLTLYSRGLGARVATLTLTRGEGGQNAMTGDFEDALGLIRTQELLAADRYFGADQFFGTEVDFGFSKTKEEAFRKWTHERVLYDAVRAVRLYRPLVLAAVFIGGVTDGHGQHQVSGQIAQEVFRAAADPTVFPELTAEGILPWAPLKVYARVPGFAITDKGLFDYATNQYVPPGFTNYVTGRTSTTPPTPDIVIHEGQTDPLLSTASANSADLHDLNLNPNTPLTYVQFARIGLGLQRTQIGPGVRLATPGVFDVTYHLYGSRLCGAAHPVTSTQPHASFTPTEPHLQPVTSTQPHAFFTPTEPHLQPVISTEAKRSGETCVPPASGTTPGPSQHPETSSFFDGVDTTINGIATLAPIPPRILTEGLHKLTDAVAAAGKAYIPSHPSASAPILVGAQHQLGALLHQLDATAFAGKADVLHELRIKQVQLNDAILCALGLHLDAIASASSTANVVRGASVSVHTALTSAAPEPIGIFAESLEGTGNNHVERLLAIDAEPSLTSSTSFTQDLEATPALSTIATRPYFYRTDAEQPVYKLKDIALRNAPATPPALTAWTVLRYHETEVRIGQVVSQKGQPLNVVPPAILHLSSSALALPDTRNAARLTAFLYPVQRPSVLPTLSAPSGWKPGLAIGDTDGPGETSFQIVAPKTGRKPTSIEAFALLNTGSGVSESFRPVGYPGLTYTNAYTPATTRIVPVDLKLPTHLRIAYLPGTGDAVADNLRSVGFDVTNLTVADLTPEHLSHFDTILLGVRTYNAHPDLHGAPTRALLDFARGGGNVIVQYQTAEFTAADAPFPLSLGSAEKVVDETTPVRLLLPSHLDPAHLAPDQEPWRALLYPNPITPADFNNWIEERGHGFLGSWDPHYTALTETHDPGAPAEHIAPQLPQEGGLVTTTLGRGHWTYVAFALYRQLPEAVPGAFRLFTDLIALADK